MTRAFASRILLAVPLLLAGCMAPPRLDRADAAAAAFPVAAFFTGRTQGDGTLDMMMGEPRSVRVTSVGVAAPGGAIRLDQRVEEEGKPARARRWSLREVSPGRYAGTLSDAAGPVAGIATGNRLHLRFAMRGGLDADQWLTLAPDGRSARNILRVRKFGATVAALDETIRKLD